MHQATLNRVDIQGRNSIWEVQTETHADLQCIGLYTATDTRADTRRNTLVFLFFSPLGLKAS